MAPWLFAISGHTMRRRHMPKLDTLPMPANGDQAGIRGAKLPGGAFIKSEKLGRVMGAD
jgi:hypothetical protein